MTQYYIFSEVGPEVERREDVRSIGIWEGPTRRAVHWNQSRIKAHSTPYTKILLLFFLNCIQAEALIQYAIKITPLSVHLHYNFFLCNSKINCSCIAPIAPPSIPSCLTWTKIFWPPLNLISSSLAMFSSYILFVMTKTKRQINFRKKKNWNLLIKLLSQTFLLNNKDTKGWRMSIRVS